MNIKILIIPGINTRTINDKIEIEPDTTIAWLLDYINKKCGIDLQLEGNFIALLDGKSVDIILNKTRIIGDTKEFMVIPMISGG